MTNEEITVDVSAAKDGGVMKTILKPGISEAHPTKGDTVYIHYVGTLDDGSQFDSSRDRGAEISFTLGRGQIISAWDMAVATMTKGELCKIHCASKYAYGEAGFPPIIPPNADLYFEIELLRWESEDSLDKTGSEKYNIPPNVALDFEIELKNVEKSKDSCHMNIKEKLIEAAKLEVRGMDYFQQGKYKLAIVQYKQIIDFLQNETTLEGEEKENRDNIYRAALFNTVALIFLKTNKTADIIKYCEKVLEKRDNLDCAALLNTDMVFLKTNESADSIKHCKKVLDDDKNNVKDLFRRTQSYQIPNVHEFAIADHEKDLTSDERNTVITAPNQPYSSVTDFLRCSPSSDTSADALKVEMLNLKLENDKLKKAMDHQLLSEKSEELETLQTINDFNKRTDFPRCWMIGKLWPCLRQAKLRLYWCSINYKLSYPSFWY